MSVWVVESAESFVVDIVFIDLVLDYSFCQAEFLGRPGLIAAGVFQGVAYQFTFVTLNQGVEFIWFFFSFGVALHLQ